MKSYLEHTCIIVNDLEKSLEIFEKVFGATVKRAVDAPNGERRRWLTGGYQINSPAEHFEPVPVHGAGLYHLGIAVDGDCEEAGRYARTLGCLPVPGKGDNWIAMPDGAVIEIMQATNADAIDKALALEPKTVFPK